jgi:hypothetical protein
LLSISVITNELAAVALLPKNGQYRQSMVSFARQGDLIADRDINR